LEQELALADVEEHQRPTDGTEGRAENAAS
jgi:hypothetical protein